MNVMADMQMVLTCSSVQSVNVRPQPCFSPSPPMPSTSLVPNVFSISFVQAKTLRPGLGILKLSNWRGGCGLCWPEEGWPKEHVAAGAGAGVGSGSRWSIGGREAGTPSPKSSGGQSAVELADANF